MVETAPSAAAALESEALAETFVAGGGFPARGGVVARRFRRTRDAGGRPRDNRRRLDRGTRGDGRSAGGTVVTSADMMEGGRTVVPPAGEGGGAMTWTRGRRFGVSPDRCAAGGV